VKSADRWALRCYPPSFRDRYGEELTALVEDVGPSRRRTAGLVLGAARAWVSPAFAGPDSTRGRLQASVATVWMAWCAGFLLTPATFKALLDPPGPGTGETVRRLLDLSAAFFVLGWVIALVGAALLAVPTLAPALRARQWSVLRPLAPAALLGLLEAVGLVAIVLFARGPTPLMVVAASAWLVGLVALLVSAGAGPAVLLARLRPDVALLRLPAVLTLGLALSLVGLCVTAAVAVLVAGDAALAGAFAPVGGAVAVAGLASVTALVSSTRGVLALRSHAR